MKNRKIGTRIAAGFAAIHPVDGVQIAEAAGKLLTKPAPALCSSQVNKAIQQLDQVIVLKAAMGFFKTGETYRAPAPRVKKPATHGAAASQTRRFACRRLLAHANDSARSKAEERTLNWIPTAAAPTRTTRTSPAIRFNAEGDER